MCKHWNVKHEYVKRKLNKQKPLTIWILRAKHVKGKSKIHKQLIHVIIDEFPMLFLLIIDMLFSAEALFRSPTNNKYKWLEIAPSTTKMQNSKFKFFYLVHYCNIVHRNEMVRKLWWNLLFHRNMSKMTLCYRDSAQVLENLE